MPASKISLDHAKHDKLFYFVANVVVYRESDQRCLILKRDPRELMHPGKWAVPGGKLEWSDLDLSKPAHIRGDAPGFEHIVEDLLIRETREEAAVEISPPFHYLESVAYVRPDETPVVMLFMAARYQRGDVVPEPGGFTDYAWVNADEITSFPCVEGLSETIQRAIRIFG